MNAPRVPSPLTALKREIEIWVGLVVFCAGISMPIIAANLVWIELRYAREAIVVPATVMERDFIPADSEENPKTRYRVRYRYSVDGVQPQEGTEEVAVDDWEARIPGSQFELAVLPGEGARPRGSGLAEKISIAGLVVMAAVFLPIGWSLGVSRLPRALGRLRVYRSGTEARAEVLEIVDSGTAINHVPMAKMRFRFTDAKGVVHEGETGLLSPSEASSLEPGAPGLVRYDEADPGISVWVDQYANTK